MVSKSILLFLLICIPLRILFALSSQYVPKDYLKYFGIILLILGLSFYYLFFSNSRLNSPEAGGITWWAPLRLIIGSFYIIAAIYAFMGKQELVWIPMSMDVIFGLIIFTIHHAFAWNP
jgi:hypothetical protein